MPESTRAKKKPTRLGSRTCLDDTRRGERLWMPLLTTRARRLADAADRAATLAAFKRTGGLAQAAADRLGAPSRSLNRRVVELGLRARLTKRYPISERHRVRRKRKRRPAG
jgi:DNA-binding NtrC family response regulator